MPAPDDVEDIDPGLARERTQLAWTRTAISLAAVGGVILKANVAAGLTVLALSLPVWGLHWIFPATVAGIRPARLLLVTATVTLVALVALVVALLGHSTFRV